MKFGLRARFIALISVILLVVYGVIASILVHSTIHQQANDLNRESTAFASLATKPIGDTFQLYQNSGTIKIVQEIDRFTALDSNVSNVQVLKATGQPQFAQNKSPISHFSEDDATSFTQVKQYGSRGQIVQIIEPYLQDSGAHPFNILYQISGTELEAALRHAVLSIVLFSVIGLIVSAGAMYLFINRFFLRPIEEVSRLATVISLGNYTQQIKLGRRDEIGTLASSVNRMAEALKADIAKLQEVDRLKNEFIMITSHNLRTPLTIIEGNLSILDDSQLSDDLSHMIKAIEESARRLNIFSEQMLTISTIEAGNDTPTLQSATLGEILKPLEEEFKPIADDKKLAFAVYVSVGSTPVITNKQQLVSALRNLLDNAFKFTETGSVDMSAEVKDGVVSIRVHDTGIGIKPDEVPKLFTKFHRGTDVLNYNYAGTGIGLYVAKLLVEQLGGTITVDSQEGHGSTFVVSLPLSQATPNDQVTPVSPSIT